MRFFTTSLFALALLCRLSSATPCVACPVSKYINVNTTNGLVTGHIASNSKCVVEYLGIPYALPPTGHLRFASPQRPARVNNYEAKSFGYDCPLSPSAPVDYPGFTSQAQRIISYFASASGAGQSEDCLTLNIWSKATGTSIKSKKPVLVFFYGGRFTIGSTDTPFYNGKYFANAEDIVVMTVNYRVNIFGFPGAPNAAPNPGLEDQRAAVEWIRENIGQFGGDVDKITIAGQSSGGVAVDYWTYAYRQDPIINGIIAPSGNAFSFPVNSPGVPEENWEAVVKAVGCANAIDALICMRQVGWKVVKKAAAAIKPTRSSSVLRSIPPFYPVPDNQTVFANYPELTEAGEFVKVPVLLSSNNNEAGYYRIPAYSRGVIPTDKQVASFLLESFTCPVSFQASARRHQSIPAWTYRYFGDWENTRLYPTSGAYHGVDLHMIFGASEDVSGLPTSTDQRQLTKTMQHAWFSFSNDPWRGLGEMGWPQFNPREKSLILLGRHNSPEAEFVFPSEFDSPCSTIVLGALATSVP